MNDRREKAAAVAFLIPAVLFMCGTGCGRHVEVVPVQGRVTLDGRPLTGGFIMLQPPAGPAARSRIDGTGRFCLQTYRPGDGVLPGRAAVRVVCFEPSAPAEGGGDAELAPGNSLIPERYTDFHTSGIMIDVVEGIAPLSIELTTP